MIPINLLETPMLNDTDKEVSYSKSPFRDDSVQDDTHET